MSEEEIIKNIKEMIQWSDHNTYKMALQGLLNLYKQNEESCTKYLAEIGQLRTKLHAEKEKNKELIQGQVKTLDEILQPELLKKYISKDKIRKKISVLEKIQSEFTNNEELRIKIITLKDLLLEEE